MLDAFNRYLTQPFETLSDADLTALNIDRSRPDEFVTAPSEFRNVMMSYPFMFKSYFTRFKVSALGGSVFDGESVGKVLQDTFGPQEGKREFRLHEVSQRVKISKNVLEKGKESPCEVVADRLAYWLREAEEKEYVTGTGSGESLGLFTPSDEGISVERDFLSAHDSFITGEDFKRAVLELEPQYRTNARWILHVNTVLLAGKLADNLGQPVYREATAGQSPTIAGVPFIMVDNAPNKISSGQYVAVLGDLSQYGVAETMEFEVHALVERDPAIKKNAYIGRTYIDGMPLREEAFVRLKMA